MHFSEWVGLLCWFAMAGIAYGYGRRDGRVDLEIAVDRYETSECRQIQLEDTVSKLWESGELDCGPEDWEGMVEQSLDKMRELRRMKSGHVSVTPPNVMVLDASQDKSQTETNSKTATVANEGE